MSATTITAGRVREFLAARYAVAIAARKGNSTPIPDTFDFLLEGVVDSFGVLEMVGAIEKEFGMELDMSGLDAEKLTIIGPLSEYVAAQPRTPPLSANGM